MIQAKPVVPDQYWILRDDQGKIGNIQAQGDGYTVSILGETAHFTSLDLLRQRVPVLFDTMMRQPDHPDPCQAHGYPTIGPAYNAIFDVQRQLPLWTDSARSRSWRAAGWYRVQQHRNWRVMQCPKLIILDRYTYRGPFHTKTEALTA